LAERLLKEIIGGNRFEKLGKGGNLKAFIKGPQSNLEGLGKKKAGSPVKARRKSLGFQTRRKHPWGGGGASGGTKKELPKVGDNKKRGVFFLRTLRKEEKLELFQKKIKGSLPREEGNCKTDRRENRFGEDAES